MFQREKAPLPTIPRPALLAWVIAGLVLPGAQPFAQTDAVRVTRERPIVERTEFDPRRPPRDMPPLTPPESGVCKTTFELRANVTYSVERLSRARVRIYVDGLDIATGLRFEIFTIENAPPKLRAHEEAHRLIGEHFYANADAIATEIGRRLIGATFEDSGVDAEAAQRGAFNQVLAAIERDYMARVRIPSSAANERFDEITKHGVEPILEADAIALAIGPTPTSR